MTQLKWRITPVLKKAKMKKLIGQDELIFSWMMFEVDYEYNGEETSGFQLEM
jgi:hypothetical protein